METRTIVLIVVILLIVILVGVTFFKTESRFMLKGSACYRSDEFHLKHNKEHDRCDDENRCMDHLKDCEQVHDCECKQLVKDQDCLTRPIDQFQLKQAAGASQNWGGYVSTSSSTNGVSFVQGTWVVPSISSSNVHTYCSAWVGIDGFSSPTVQQLGTEHEWIPGKGQSHYAWFEMYPQYPYRINGFPVVPGDVITASVRYVSNGIYQMTIANLTRRVYFAIPTSYTRSTVAQRRSAEWIAEAPYMNGILPLANFNRLPFMNCVATINGITGPINRFANNAITMVTAQGTAKAIPSVLTNNGQNFTMTWAHQ